MGILVDGDALRAVVRANYNAQDSTDNAYLDSMSQVRIELPKAADGAAATTTAETMVFGSDRQYRVKEIYYQTAAALTADNTNNATITVSKRDAAGANKTTVATATTSLTGTGSWTAWTSVGFTLSTTGGALTLVDGGALTFEIAKAGSGVVVPAGVLVVVLEVL